MNRMWLIISLVILSISLRPPVAMGYLNQGFGFIKDKVYLEATPQNALKQERIFPYLNETLVQEPIPPLSKEFIAQLLDFYFPLNEWGPAFLSSEKSITEFVMSLPLEGNEKNWVLGEVSTWERLDYPEEQKKEELNLRLRIYPHVYNLQYPEWYERYKQEKDMFPGRQIPLPNFKEVKEFYKIIAKWTLYIAGGFSNKAGLSQFSAGALPPTSVNGSINIEELRGDNLVFSFRHFPTGPSQLRIKFQIHSEFSNFNKVSSLKLFIEGQDQNNYAAKEVFINLVDINGNIARYSIEGIPLEGTIIEIPINKYGDTRDMTIYYRGKVDFNNIYSIEIKLDNGTEPLQGKISLEDIHVEIKEDSWQDIGREIRLTTRLIHELTPSGASRVHTGLPLLEGDVAGGMFGGPFSGPLFRFIDPVWYKTLLKEPLGKAVVNSELNKWVNEIKKLISGGMGEEDAADKIADKLLLWRDNEVYLKNNLVKINKTLDTFSYRWPEYREVIDVFNVEVEKLLSSNPDFTQDRAREEAYLEGKTSLVLMKNYILPKLYHEFRRVPEDKQPIPIEYAPIEVKRTEIEAESSDIRIVKIREDDPDNPGGKRLRFVRKDSLDAITITRDPKTRKIISATAKIGNKEVEIVPEEIKDAKGQVLETKYWEYRVGIGLKVKNIPLIAKLEGGYSPEGRYAILKQVLLTPPNNKILFQDTLMQEFRYSIWEFMRGKDKVEIIVPLTKFEQVELN